MTTFLSTVETQFGPFSIIADADGAVLASGWTAQAPLLLALIDPALRATEPVRRSELGAATRAAQAYHRGDLLAVSEVAVRQPGLGEFLSKALRHLCDVEPGQTVTYTQLAGLAGNAAAARAAASACARNAAALFVPCHRVLRTGGALGGFRWGTQIKRALLDHESDRSGNSDRSGAPGRSGTPVRASTAARSGASAENRKRSVSAPR